MESTFQTIKVCGSLEDWNLKKYHFSHFFVHIADQQLRHYVPAAFQILQSSRPIPKHQSRGLDRTPDHPLDAEVAYIEYFVVACPPAGTA